MTMSGDLISREALIEALKERGRQLLKLGTSFEANIASVTALECVNIAKDAPAVDAVPVVHGRWVNQDNTYTRYRCSACNMQNCEAHYKYCPNCGVKMDGDEDALD